MSEITLSHIESAARQLREARDEVAAIVAQLNADIAKLQAEARARIKRTVTKTADRHAQLRNLIDTNRHLFVQPKTQTFHGITCGLNKGKGKIEYDDAKQVIAAIEKKLPGLITTLIKTKKSLVKAALKNVPVADLQRIGCTVEETGDYVVVRYTDKEVDKLVNALLESAVADATSEEEAA